MEETTHFMLIDDKDSLKKAIAEIKTESRENKLIALDCEGVSLSRDGKLTIVTIATRNKAYIFDVLKLEMSVFDDGVREILEDKSVEKLMFDCRQDADSLWHTFNVKLTGVLDLQLLEIMYRRDETSSTSAIKHQRLSRNVDDVENVYGYKKCIEVYIKDEKMLAAKTVQDGSSNKWLRRPLRKDLINYGCVDSIGLFKLYDVLRKDGAYLDRLRVASERFANIYRDLEKRTHSEYECNAYLPLDIIPEKGMLMIPVGTTKCVTCSRMFPSEEFSNIQLGRGEQKCRVCKKNKTSSGYSERN